LSTNPVAALPFTEVGIRANTLSPVTDTAPLLMWDFPVAAQPTKPDETTMVPSALTLSDLNKHGLTGVPRQGGYAQSEHDREQVSRGLSNRR
jgi:hypothetical protein